MAKKTEPGHVFVTYARANSAVVLPTVEKIVESGYKVWYDKGISPSSTWTDEIAKAIMECKIVVAFISKEAMDSPYVRNEIEFAISNHKKILPVYLDGMDVLPPGLALVLNTTQGVVGKKNPGELAEQICAGLLFYGTMQKGLTEGGKKPRRTLIAVAVILLAAIAAAGGWSFQKFRVADSRNILLNKDIYLPAEPMTIKLVSVTQNMIDDAALVGIWKPGNATADYISYTYVKQEGMKLRAPSAAGTYEIRFYSSDKLLPENQAGRKSFKVSANSIGAFKMAVNSNEYISQEPIKITITGVPQLMLWDGAIIGVYKSGAQSEDFLRYTTISRRDQEITFDAPIEAGKYEIRAYSNSDVLKGETLVAQTAVNILARPQSPEEIAGNSGESEHVLETDIFSPDDWQHSK